MQLPAPALITLDGHRLSSLYRESILTLTSFWFKYFAPVPPKKVHWNFVIVTSDGTATPLGVA
jgi:hypothetical protein